MKSRQVARAFGRVLRAARIAHGLSQEALAERADLSRTYPSLLERGLREPTLCVFFRLCTALRQPPAALLEATLRAAHRTSSGLGPGDGAHPPSHTETLTPTSRVRRNAAAQPPAVHPPGSPL